MKEVIICEKDFYDLLEDELISANVFFDMLTEEEHKEMEFTEDEMSEYMTLLNNLMDFIDNHAKKVD